MKKNFIYLFLICVLITNIYLIFCWQPQNKVDVEEKLSKETISYTKSIYKLDKGKVLEKLSSDDKKEFKKIIEKLSTIDIGKIKEYYDDINEEEGVVNIFKLLKRRLAIKDYERIHEISSSFIDFNTIEGKIKNN